jgi:hypothetical protein
MVCLLCVVPLGRHLIRIDVSFASIYMLDRRHKRAILAKTVGDLRRGSGMCPEIVSLSHIKLSYVLSSFSFSFPL